MSTSSLTHPMEAESKSPRNAQSTLTKTVASGTSAATSWLPIPTGQTMPISPTTTTLAITDQMTAPSIIPPGIAGAISAPINTALFLTPTTGPPTWVMVVKSPTQISSSLVVIYITTSTKTVLEYTMPPNTAPSTKSSRITKKPTNMSTTPPLAT